MATNQAWADAGKFYDRVRASLEEERAKFQEAERVFGLALDRERLAYNAMMAARDKPCTDPDCAS